MLGKYSKNPLSALRDLTDRDFWRAFLPFALPITLQQLLLSSLNLVDAAMVAHLGDTAVASVGLAGQLSSFINIVLFGVASGGSVFIAQYWGAGDHTGIRRSFGVMTMLNICLAVAMCVACAAAPRFIISVFTDEPAMAEEAAVYLRVAGFAYIGVALTQTMGTVLRSTENVRLPMYAGIISSLIKIALNYALIFGRFGFNPMGVRGAAVATVVSSLIGPAILFSVSLLKRNVIARSPREIFTVPWSFFVKFMRRAYPVVLNEGFWSLGVLGYNMVLGRMGTENYAAFTICRTAEELSMIFFAGMCNACNIIVGKRVGAGDIEEAKWAARRFILLEPVMGIMVGVLIIAARPALLSLFNVTDTVRSAASLLLFIFGLEVTLRHFPYISIVGVFRAGGDTKTGMRYDFLCMYAIALPAVALSGLVAGLPFAAVYLIMLLCEDVPKSLLCLRHFSGMKWVQPVVDAEQI